MKYLAGVIGGFVFAWSAGIVARMFFAGTALESDNWFTAIVGLLWLLAIWRSHRAASSRDAWSQIIGAFGFMLFLAPIALAWKFNNDSPDIQNHSISTDPTGTAIMLGGTAFLCWPIAFVCAFINYLLDKKSDSATPSVKSDPKASPLKAE